MSQSNRTPEDRPSMVNLSGQRYQPGSGDYRNPTGYLPELGMTWEEWLESQSDVPLPISMFMNFDGGEPFDFGGS